MTTKFCVLNLTKSARLRAKRLNVDPLLLGDTTVSIDDATKIPTDSGPLILYIVGHAVPDALLVPSGETESEKDVVAKIIARRRNKPTLIVWDFCYAKSFEKIKNQKWGTKPYVHIFSCEAYEQSWHTGSQVQDGGPITLFSIALQEALRDGIASWDELQERLRARLGRVQTPSILLPLAPADFGLAPPSADPRRKEQQKVLVLAPSKVQQRKRKIEKPRRQVPLGPAAMSGRVARQGSAVSSRR